LKDFHSPCLNPNSVHYKTSQGRTPNARVNVSSSGACDDVASAPSHSVAFTVAQRARASLLQHVSAAGLDMGSHDQNFSRRRQSVNHAQANLSLRHSVSFFFDLLPAVPLPLMNLRVMVCLPFISAKDFASHPEASLGTRFRLSPLCCCFRVFFHAFIALTPSFSIDGVSTKTSKNDVIHECERYGKVTSCSLRKCVISSIRSCVLLMSTSGPTLL
jgi:hypothetical protein